MSAYIQRASSRQLAGLGFVLSLPAFYFAVAVIATLLLATITVYGILENFVGR